MKLDGSDLEIVAFWGGDRRGPCLGIYRGPGYVELTRDEIRLVHETVTEWLFQRACEDLEEATRRWKKSKPDEVTG